MSSTAGRSIHWNGEGAVSEEGAAPGAIKLTTNELSGSPVWEVSSVSCFAFQNITLT